ncbi:MAG: FAD-binding oxidoreductase, partial [Candidatus Thorarchaeota archaeon]
MTLKRKLAEQLREVFEDRVITEKHELVIHAMDVGSLPKQVGWLMNPNPDAMVQPLTPEEVKFLYEFANEHKVPLVPRGAGTSGYGGAIPRKGGIVVDMRGMEKIIEVDEENMTVTVEPGLSWANLQFELNRRNLDTRCYPSSGLSATIGGWIAQGGDGIGSLKYGTINENVVELEVVLPTGKIVKSKDTDLFCDTEGILGIITKAKLKIKPLTPIKVIVASFPENYLMVHAIEKILEDSPMPFTIKFEESKYTDLKKQVWESDEKFPFPVHHGTIMVAYDGPEEEVDQGFRVVEEVTEMYRGVVYDEQVAEHEWHD